MTFSIQVSFRMLVVCRLPVVNMLHTDLRHQAARGHLGIDLTTAITLAAELRPAAARRSEALSHEQ
jgi:hypothetical protein